MPWTPADAKRHKRGLSPRQARQWAAVANSVLSRCLARGGFQSRCEGSAVRQANSAVGAPARPTSNTALLTINTALTVQPQRLQRHEQDYLVAPCVMLVAGVLNGGLVVNEAIVPQDWDHIPVVVNHPQDATGGAVSARSPDVLSACGIGQVFHARLGQGLRRGHAVASLVGELWINLADVARCGLLAQQAVQMLEAQQPLEVSTAFYPDVSPTPGLFHGTPYTEVYTRLRPDHLALLPNGVGACSWQDGGCGAPRLNQCGCLDAECVCQQGVTPMEDTATASRWQRFWQFVQEFMPEGTPEDGDDAETPETEASTPALNHRQQELVAARARQAQGLPLTTHEQCMLSEPALYAAQHTPIMRLNQTDTDVREALYGCLAREMERDVTPIYIDSVDLATQTFTYRLGERLCQRSWTVEEGVIALTDDHADVQRTTTYTAVPDSPAGPQGMPGPETYSTEEAPMAVTPTVKARVDALITDERTDWTELDRPDLEQLSDSVLIRMASQPLPARVQTVTGPRPLTEVLADLVPEERDALEDAIVTQQERKEQLLTILLANKLNPFTREELQGKKIKQLEQLVVFGGDVLPGQPTASVPLTYQGRRMPHLRIVPGEGESQDDMRPPALPNTMELVVEEQKRRGIRF